MIPFGCVHCDPAPAADPGGRRYRVENARSANFPRASRTSDNSIYSAARRRGAHRTHDRAGEPCRHRDATGVSTRGPSRGDRDRELEVRGERAVLRVRSTSRRVPMPTLGPPAVIIGSIASVIPSRSCGPRPALTKFGTCGSSCMSCPTPWPTRVRTTESPLLDDRLDRAEMSPTRLPALARLDAGHRAPPRRRRAVAARPPRSRRPGRSRRRRRSSRPASRRRRRR